MLLLVVAVGITGHRRGKRPVERFTASREVHWLPLGASLAASSTSADTPLLIAGAVYADGLAGNWFWWASAPGVLATLFFFSRLWRRSGVLTDVGILRLRYGNGMAANCLRCLRALLEGVILNVLILASNGYALTLVIEAMFERWSVASPNQAAIITMAVGFAGATIFVLFVGFRGLVRSSLTEFSLTVATGTGFAIVAVSTIPGGLHGLQALISERSHAPALSMAPSGGMIGPLLLLAVGWWHTAPGRGLLVQRLAAAQDERAALLTVGSFSIFHFVLRPWSWYLIGLAALFYLPGQTGAETALPRLAATILPSGLYGILVAVTALAFTGCVTSRLNLGASYLVNDVVRVVAPDASETILHRVEVGTAVFLAIVASAIVATGRLTSIRDLYQFITIVLAGTGFVAIARWYWWRTSLMAEIASLGAAIVGAIMASHLLDLTEPDAFVVATVINFALGAAIAIVFALFGPSTPTSVLRRFYDAVTPEGPGWRPFCGSMSRDGIKRTSARWLLANGALFAAITACACLIALQPIYAMLCILLATSLIVGVYRLRPLPPQS